MAANIFKIIDGTPVYSLDEFMRRENLNGWNKIEYHPEKLEPETRRPIKFENKKFTEVSFKDTDIKNVRFLDCEFHNCIFFRASIVECEFIDCRFYSTNTNKIKIISCLIDPISFKGNFDLKEDTNIAVNLYQALYRNASDTNQPNHILESLYMMKKSEGAHLNSQKKRGKIRGLEYLRKKFPHKIYDFTAGYGFKIWKVARLFLIAVSIFSAINYFLRDYIFKEDTVISVVDSIYFTCITVTTLGYGDIVPVTQVGRLIIVFQVIFGFTIISIFLAALANRILRLR